VRAERQDIDAFVYAARIVGDAYESAIDSAMASDHSEENIDVFG
jgi:hypothetical protein